MFDSQKFRSVMDRAVAVAVVADSAIEKVIAQNAIHGFALRIIRGGRIRLDIHSLGNGGSTCSGKGAVNLDHAGIAGLDWSNLRVVAHLRDFDLTAVEEIDETLTSPCFVDQAVNRC
jgi:hypothetical protein